MFDKTFVSRACAVRQGWLNPVNLKEQVVSYLVDSFYPRVSRSLTVRAVQLSNLIPRILYSIHSLLAKWIQNINNIR